MAQAKTLTQAELDQVLRYVSTKRYAKRDRCLILTSFWSGMRVGEIAQLKMGDVVNEDGTIKSEIRLSAQQTKGKKVFCVGFAAETHDLKKHGQEKLQRKNIPMLVANIGPKTFGLDENQLMVIEASGITEMPAADKLSLSRQLIHLVSTKI